MYCSERMAKTTGPTPAKAQLGPPPRWLKCPRKGLSVAGRFVACKTPLCELYDEFVPEMYRFTPEMVFNSMQSQYQKIGVLDRSYQHRQILQEGASGTDGSTLH